jgi:hypothetical protein
MTANPPGVAPHRDRIAVLVGLIAVIATSLVYLLLGAGIEMDKMDMGGDQVMLMTPAWTAGYAALALLMWAVMMAAMMLPSAAPAILQVVGLAHEQGEKASGVASALFFTTGYLMVWTRVSLRGEQQPRGNRRRALLPERGWPIDAGEKGPGAAGFEIFQSNEEVRRSHLPDLASRSGDPDAVADPRF